jgi:exosome complex component CSL4
VKSNGHIYASLVGRLQITEVGNDRQKEEDENDEEESKKGNNTKTSKITTPSYICSVRTKTLPAAAQVLRIGQVVIGRVVRISPQNAIVDIQVAEHVGPLRTSYEGAIRMEDIRVGATEQIRIEECFRPGDIVACRVISLGDPRRYFLSTAETELGVIRAMSSKGIPMVPISWKEMECPETGVREPRKCAKPIQLK